MLIAQSGRLEEGCTKRRVSELGIGGTSSGSLKLGSLELCLVCLTGETGLCLTFLLVFLDLNYAYEL